MENKNKCEKRNLNEIWNVPPRIKVLEALGAIADNRIKIKKEKTKKEKIKKRKTKQGKTKKEKVESVVEIDETKVEGKCISSEGDKVYTIKMAKQKETNKIFIFSDDNGSMFKGYLGYPSIAFLMLKEYLSYDEKLAKALTRIPWKKLNEKFKNYFKTEFVVKQMLKKKGIQPDEINTFVEKVLEEIKEKKFRKLIQKKFSE